MVEKLTRDMVAAAEQYIDNIDEMGGALAAIEKGFPQREIQESSYRYQREIEAEERVVVGVNKFDTPYSKLESLNRVNPGEEKKQIAGLQKVKMKREDAAVKTSLENLRQVALGTENTMPAFLGCVEAYATVGEICDTLREVFGVQREFLII